jgi:hypothetical protein
MIGLYSTTPTGHGLVSALSGPRALLLSLEGLTGLAGAWRLTGKASLDS